MAPALAAGTAFGFLLNWKRLRNLAPLPSPPIGAASLLLTKTIVDGDAHAHVLRPGAVHHLLVGVQIQFERQVHANERLKLLVVLLAHALRQFHGDLR